MKIQIGIKVFLYASDWTTPGNISKMESAGFPHTGRLIKIFATETDPSEIIKRPISTARESADPFIEGYKYQSHGPWLATDLEFFIQHHCRGEEQPIRQTRALFRFANRPDLGIINLAMSIKNKETGRWHYSHPLKIIDGLEEVRVRGRYNGLHLDVFTPQSLERLGKIIDLKNPEALVTMREAVLVSKHRENTNIQKERN